MMKGLLLVVAGLGAGFAISWWLQPNVQKSSQARSAVFSAASSSNASLPIDGSRLASLEEALNTEIAERVQLEARVQQLAAALADGRDESAAAPAEAVGAPAEGLGRRPTRNANAPREDAQRRQVEQLLAAGFAPDRAEWIDRRTSELRMQRLQAQYDATREGRAFDPATLIEGERILRGELGDTDYERYLQALGRPTSVTVRDVLVSSPAERSGLKPGDAVVAYDGQRVFDMRELNALTLEGNAGESVVVEVRRDGSNVQLVMPRGPIGIFGGGFRGR